jgi:hypothetical protein
MKLPMKSDFTYHQREDGILVFKFKSFDKEALNHWSRIGIQFDMYAAERHLHIRTLYLLDPNAFLTLDAIQKITESAKRTPPNLCESMAIVITNNTMLTLLQLVTSKIQNIAHTSFFFCHTPEEAIKWLNQRKDHFFQTKQIPPITYRLWDSIIIEEQPDDLSQS